MSCSSQVPNSTEKPVALFSGKNRSSQEMFFRQKIFRQNINRFWETTNLYSDSLTPENSIKSFLEEHRD